MRTVGSTARSFPVWHLLLIALALAILVLFCPGRSAASELQPSSDVLVPFFEVDLADPDLGLTTLFSVCNDSPGAVDLLMTVHSNWGIPLLRIPLTLNGDEVRSFNLRDWLYRGDLPDRDLSAEELAHVQAALSGRPSPADDLYYGTEVEPDMAVGYVTLRTTSPDRPDVLWGDYFMVEARHSFFQAETLVDIDPAGCAPATCKRHAVRFLDGGMLTDGTQLLIWTERRWAPSPSPDHPFGTFVATEMEVYDEPGRHVEDRDLGLLPTEMLKVGDLELQPRFGWLEVVTEEPSFITQHLHTTGDPSSALHAWCLPEEPQAPGADIKIDKFVNGVDADHPTGPSIPVGAAITWEFRVKNTGSLLLTDVVVTDDGTPIACPQTTLSPKESMTCTLTGTAEACQQRNMGKAMGFAPDGTEIYDEDLAHYFGEPHGAITVKTRLNGFDADGPEGTWPQFDPGDTLNWTFDVTNTGDVELTEVSVKADPLAVTCPKTVLQPAEVMTCTATSMAEGPGTHSLSVSAEGNTPCGPVATVGQATYANYLVVILEPAIDVEKLVNGQDADVPPGPAVELGATLTWSFVVTNVGDVPLSNVAVTDPAFPALTCPKTSLAVGESMTCTAQGTAQACLVSNLATATGMAPDEATVSDQDPAYYTGQIHPALGLEKLVEGQDADTAPGPDLLVGSTAHWSYQVTNLGDVPLTGISVTDDRLGAVTCPKTELAPGEAMTCTAQAAVVAGQYRNVGTALGTPACGPAVSAGDPAHYYGRSPSISLKKLTNGEDADTPTGPTVPVGAPVLWTYVVTNTGDTALTGVAVTDDKGVMVTCPKTELSPGESMTCTASGTAVAGQYANVGTATGKPPVGPDVTDTDPSHYLGYQPLITLEKRINGQDADTPPGPGLLVGSTIAWTYLVTNTGDVKLTGVSVTDDQGLAVTCPKTALEPGESMTCTASSTAVAGQHRNVGTATGMPPSGPAVTATDPANYVGLTPGISLEKLVNGFEADTAPGPTFLVGTQLLWTYIVTNTGDVTLTNVGVTDSDGFPVQCPKTTLAPGESMTCSACAEATFGLPCPSYCLAIAGQQANIGRATGTPDGGSPIWAEDPAHYWGQQLGNQGCTPGYWKNHTDSWPPTGYTTTQKVKTVFTSVTTFYPTLGNATLYQALGFDGGPGGEGAAEILLRAGVAALLNASHPDVAYPRTEASVISDVNNALLQSRDSMLALAAQLDADNNRGCPLN